MMRMGALSPADMKLSSKLPSTTSLEKSKDQKQLEKAAKQFEGYFMDMVMQSMRNTVDESNTFADSQQTKMFQSMLDTEFAKISGEKGSIGLSDAIVRQMSPHLMPPSGVEAKKAP